MTLIWFVIWFIANWMGGPEPLHFDPVNFWTGWLLLSIALDLCAHQATASRSRRRAT
jgi:hypothetical protein